jgi:AraC-like DNA-binding protein/mannose-6-phosphate isomerase-like protein (cupin superfamily)
MKQPIPVHRMDASMPSGIGFTYMEIESEQAENMVKAYANTAHRDDYYLFAFLEAGEILLTVDFEEMQLAGNDVFYVRPGQVHAMSSIRETRGWMLTIDAMLVEKDCKNTFEGQFLTQRPVALEASVAARMGETARLLHAAVQAKPAAFGSSIVLNLAHVFIGMIAGQYAERQENLLHHQSRSARIAHQFKDLLSENFRTLKSPTQYAQTLNYSLSHLNESVKHTTGFPVSYWIHQQVVLEAKRLLYYTGLDVREIAFSLGYEDYTYFSRLFSKAVGIPPNAFRRKFRK